MNFLCSMKNNVIHNAALETKCTKRPMFPVSAEILLIGLAAPVAENADISRGKPKKTRGLS
jgi:hypothetical protein